MFPILRGRLLKEAGRRVPDRESGFPILRGRLLKVGEPGCGKTFAAVSNP